MNKLRRPIIRDRDGLEAALKRIKVTRYRICEIRMTVDEETQTTYVFFVPAKRIEALLLELERLLPIYGTAVFELSKWEQWFRRRVWLEIDDDIDQND